MQARRKLAKKGDVMTDAAIKAREAEAKERSVIEAERDNQRKDRRERAKIAEEKRQNERMHRLKSVDSAVNFADKMLSKAGDTFDFMMRNHPDWYTKGQEDLVDTTVSDNFGYAMGTLFKASLNGYDTEGIQANDVASIKAQGIAVLSYVNTLGISSEYSPTDPVNRAAARLFSLIQANTNYTKPYQANDAITLIACEREMITLIYYIQKLFRLYITYQNSNLYFNRSIFHALGIDFADLDTNIASYRKRYKRLLSYFDEDIRMPIIPLFLRAAQIAGGLYADNSSAGIYTQMYTFRPIAYGVLNDAASAAGSEKIKNFYYGYTSNSTSMKMGTLLDKLELMITTVIRSDSYKFINGDISRVFSTFFTTNDVNIDVPLLPIDDPYTLDQIRNATILNSSLVDWKFTEADTANGMINSRVILPEGISVPTSLAINFWGDDKVDKARVLEATRLCAVVSPSFPKELAECGTEVVAYVTTTNLVTADNLNTSSSRDYVPVITITTDPDRTTWDGNISDLFEMLQAIVAYDNLPKPYILEKTVDDPLTTRSLMYTG